MPQPSIRKYKPKDIEAVLNLFTEENKIAHSFLPEKALAEAKDGMCLLLQNSQEKAWVMELERQIIGFISTQDKQDHVRIVALFMANQHQGKKWGPKLMDKAESVIKKALELAVYKENPRAVKFYKKRGFTIQRSGEDNGHKFWVMKLER
jgi:putative acetyltransferase